MRSLNNHIFLTVLCILLFFTGLGSTSLWDADETSNARAAVEMMERGDYVVPTLNGSLRTDKPPLHYWFMIAAFRIFGTNEFAARFFTAVFGLLTVLLVNEVGTRVFGRTGGFISGLALACAFLFSVSSRAATTDAYLIFFTNLAVFAAFFSARRPALAVLSWISMGFAVLAKGPVGIVLPLGAIVIFAFFYRGSEFSFRRFCNPVGILVFLAIATPWYALAAGRTGGDLIEGFFIKHNVARFLKPMESHRGPFYFYFLVLLPGFFPWAVFLPQAFAATLRWRRSALKHAGFGLLLITWSLTVILFFSVARTKLPTYILPAFPALSLMMGALASSVETSFGMAERGFTLSWLISFLPAAFLPGIIFVAFSSRVPDLAAYSAAAAPMIAASVVGLIFCLAARPLRAFRWAAYCAVLGLAGIHLVAAPALENVRMAPIAGRAVARAASPDDALATLGYYRPGIVFYSGRNTVGVNSAEHVQKFIERPQGRFLIAGAEEFFRLPETLRTRFRIIEKGLDAADSNRVILVAERIDQNL